MNWCQRLAPDDWCNRTSDARGRTDDAYDATERAWLRTDDTCDPTEERCDLTDGACHATEPPCIRTDGPCDRTEDWWEVKRLKMGCFGRFDRRQDHLIGVRRLTSMKSWTAYLGNCQIGFFI